MIQQLIIKLLLCTSEPQRVKMQNLHEREKLRINTMLLMKLFLEYLKFLDKLVPNSLFSGFAIKSQSFVFQAIF